MLPPPPTGGREQVRDVRGGALRPEGDLRGQWFPLEGRRPSDSGQPSDLPYQSTILCCSDQLGHLSLRSGN